MPVAPSAPQQPSLLPHSRLWRLPQGRWLRQRASTSPGHRAHTPGQASASIHGCHALPRCSQLCARGILGSSAPSSTAAPAQPEEPRGKAERSVWWRRWPRQDSAQHRGMLPSPPATQTAEAEHRELCSSGRAGSAAPGQPGSCSSALLGWPTAAGDDGLPQPSGSAHLRTPQPAPSPARGTANPIGSAPGCSEALPAALLPAQRPLLVQPRTRRLPSARASIGAAFPLPKLRQPDVPVLGAGVSPSRLTRPLTFLLLNEHLLSFTPESRRGYGWWLATGSDSKLVQTGLSCSAKLPPCSTEYSRVCDLVVMWEEDKGEQGDQA